MYLGFVMQCELSIVSCLDLTNSAARQTGATIIGNEARQNSLLRQYLGIDYFNGEHRTSPLNQSFRTVGLLGTFPSIYLYHFRHFGFLC